MYFVRTLQQNGVVERQNRTLVEAARTMLIFSRAPLFLWAEAISTACFTQNHSIIHRRFNKTPYELIYGRKPDISFLHVFVALYYPKNDRKDIGKLGAKGDIGFFIAMYDDYIGGQPLATRRTVPPAQEPQVRQPSKASTTIADTVPTPTNSSSLATNIPITSQDVDKLNSNAMVDGNTFVNPFANSSTSAAASSSSQNDHPLEQVIGEPSRPVLTRNQLRFDGDICMYALSVSTMEPKNVKEAITDLAWIDSMQEELLQFKRHDVYVDDIIFGSTHPRYIQLFSDLMKSRFEMSMMGEMTFFLGLQVNQSPRGIFINQSKYVLEILKKYGMKSCDTVGTLMEIKDKLDLDQNGTPVDATKYRSMIGALMYLTSSRPDIVHATCLCARYQAKPTKKHLKEVKRIFHYLRGTINTGLWYTKDSGFELTGFLDADYAGCKDTFKSTSSGA
uniref:Uncharacterized mitochondrial protein AtMg00810-like n=1 Tax=Tanacetum cinerariifolium TaxID=118510 RepID=A0A6L2NFX7_TANCI|nr:uncharacterized mitochondrial protein AtMg00810-like [Tanacetum cinerariifolium]